MRDSPNDPPNKLWSEQFWVTLIWRPTISLPPPPTLQLDASLSVLLSHCSICGVGLFLFVAWCHVEFICLPAPTLLPKRNKAFGFPLMCVSKMARTGHYTPLPFGCSPLTRPLEAAEGVGIRRRCGAHKNDPSPLRPLPFGFNNLLILEG